MGTDLATPRDRLGMDERRGPDPLVASGGADSFQLRSELLGIAFVDYAPVPPRMQYAIFFSSAEAGWSESRYGYPSRRRSSESDGVVSVKISVQLAC